MIDAIPRNWWALVVRGIIAILFGLLAVVWPGLTVTALIILFGAYAVVDGIFTIVAAAMGGGMGNRWGLLLEGIVSVIAGIIAFVWPGLTALALLYVIAFWAIVTGILEIVAAVRLRREITNELALGIAGVLSILFGLIAIVFPRAGALSIIWIIAVYAILFGILLIALGLRVRSWTQTSGSGLGRPI
jgi:uncharacterized membrane protein HdeD (DUF308 family)